MLNVLRYRGRIDLWRLTICIAISEGVGLLSSFFTVNAREIFQTLILPPFAPANGVFEPVWTILYLLMGVACYRICMYGVEKLQINNALGFYGIQLALNFLWSLVFFGLGLLGAAFFMNLLLLIFIFITSIKFYAIDKKAGYLMLPYILWVTYAVALNYSIWLLNR